MVDFEKAQKSKNEKTVKELKTALDIFLEHHLDAAREFKTQLSNETSDACTLV